MMWYDYIRMRGYNMNKQQKRRIFEFFLIIVIVLGSLFYEKYVINESDLLNVQKRQDEEVEQTTKLTDGSNLKIYFIDVGQADSILITNNGENMLIDAGNNEDGKKLVAYFQSLGITQFSYVVGTHAHEDHIGGMDDIIKNFSIEHFYMPDAITTTLTFEEVLDALEEKSIAFETPEVDSTFSMADCKFEVLYVGDEENDLNDTSIVLKMNFGNRKYLFMGDATSKVEKKILNKDLKSDVLKVGHHGSQYSSTREFLEKVSPSYAIIQVGVNNSYQHPKQETLNRLKEAGIKVYRTDEEGTIILSSDGENISFDSIHTDTNG